MIAVNRKNDRAILLIDHAIDAVCSVGALNGIFAQTQPGVAIDLAGRESADGHVLGWQGRTEASKGEQTIRVLSLQGLQVSRKVFSDRDAMVRAFFPAATS